MPPKKKAQSAASSSSSSSTKEPCCVCLQSITLNKDEHLFCSGDCQQRLHRYCVGVSLKCYKELNGNSDVFYCFVCSERRNKKDIATLTSTVELLRQEISDLKSSLSRVQPLSEDDRSANSQQAMDSVVASGESTNLISATISNKSGLSTSNKRVDPDRKFNVGIEECQKGAPKLSGLDNSIQSPSIRDTFRLGKFSTYHHDRPRPLLVKFVRAADVSSVLSKRSLLKHPIVIKPDLTPEERQRDSILLKERWTLIQSGVPRNSIKIRDSRLFVKNKLFGYVDHSKFQFSSDNPSSSNQSCQ